MKNERINWQVFLSIKNFDDKAHPTKDSILANEIYEFLTERNIKTFFSNKSLEILGADAYKQAIDNALDSCNVLVAVGTSRENLESKWVRYEWDSFLHDTLSGSKPHGRMFVYVQDVDINTLPRGLRQSQTIKHGEDSLEQLYRFINNEATAISQVSQKQITFTKPFKRKQNGIFLKLIIAALILLIIIATTAKLIYPKVTTNIQCDSCLGAMPWLNWIVYDPTEYNPYANIMPSESSIRKDLIVLKQHGIDGLITMNSKGNCRHIARIAHEEGFNKVIVGVWDIRDKDELANAISVSKWADAYCLGQKGLHRYYEKDELISSLKYFKSKTKKCVTTSESISDYATNSDILSYIDFVFPDVHLVDPLLTPKMVYDSTVNLGKYASEKIKSNKLILMKMIAFPSDGGINFTFNNQVEFYRLMVEDLTRRSDIPSNVLFSYMTAFDPVWKTLENHWPVYEMHTGLFKINRDPKPVMLKVEWQIKHR